MEASPLDPQRKCLPCLYLEGFPVAKLAGLDYKLEIVAGGESLLEKLVELFPTAPMCRRWPGEIIGKVIKSERELAEEGRLDC